MAERWIIVDILAALLLGGAVGALCRRHPVLAMIVGSIVITASALFVMWLMGEFPGTAVSFQDHFASAMFIIVPFLLFYYIPAISAAVAVSAVWARWRPRDALADTGEELDVTSDNVRKI